MTDKTQLEQIVNLIDNISYVEDGVLDAAQQLRDLFVEQACEAIDSVTTNSKAPGFNNGYDNCKEKVKQAIMDKFK